MPREKLKERPDGRFRCKYDGKYFYGRTQQEAIAKREHYKRVKEQGLRAETEGYTVRQYSAKWLPTHKAGVERETYNAYANHLDRMNDVIGDKAIMHVIPSDIKTVYNQYIGMSKSSIDKARTVINSMFKTAVRDGLIRSNPCEGVKPHDAPSGTHRAITDEELQLILDTPSRMRLPVLVMRYAGLRRGEVLALRMEDIDFEKKVIHVNKAIKFRGNKAIQKSTKTDAGIRDVPLFMRLEVELKGHTGYITGKKMSRTAFRRAWEAYVNTVERKMNGCQKRWYGRTKDYKKTYPERYAEFTALEREAKKLRDFKMFDEAKKKQEEADTIRLIGWKSFTVRTHDLRHSFVTMLCDANVEIDLAMKWCGHSDEKMIRHIYDHVSDYRVRKATVDVENVMQETM